MIKKTLVAIGISSLMIGALGCADGPDVDNDVLRNLPPGMEVVVVEFESTEATEHYDTAYFALVERPRLLEEHPQLDDSLAEVREDVFGTTESDGSGAAIGDSVSPLAYTPVGSIRETLPGNEVRPVVANADLPTAEYHGVEQEAGSSDVANPCECDGPECMTSWVEANLGCNVCAVFVCGDDNTPHACNVCQ